ncbi:tRNA(Ile)-lysidine synthase [Prosthecobacter debontii]|uniref:tRNA(Ile)-lysidine synthase n=1 Tax=Prosthecobacter debontii TaxID=48467 RepID=A0A1T4YT37_9BACT|nr:tRNA lysidine(34) synthetase TilS [Prosthecobacter debontii]SKB04813.1 tRNA(Ile)-lysidine synthase [Prosthecobacter debontii]
MPSSFLLADLDLATPALVAVSGGRDSVMLLDLLMKAGHPSLIVCHLNHGLRGRESGQDAVFVRRLARHYGLPCEVEKVNVRQRAKDKRISLELAAREARYEFLQRVAHQHGVQRLYLAHHADDQAETILANLCRGSGIAGLRGMQVETSLNGMVLVRPLLSVRRVDIDAYVQAHRLPYREDSSNRSALHRRNRLRHEVLPLLNAVYARDVAPIVTRLGRLAARDEDYLKQQVLSFLEKEQVIEEDGSLNVTSQLRQLHPALLARVLHFWLGDQLGLPGVDAEVVEAASGMLAADGPAKVNLPGSRWLRRKARRLWVEGG